MKCIHHNDVDGRSAAAVVASFTGNYNKRDYIEADYNTQFDYNMFGQREKVYIVDFSFGDDNSHILNKLLSKKCDVIWIDHHKTSMDYINENSEDLDMIVNLEYYVHTDRSGAMLTWEYLYKPKETPYFIQLISDFDCWNNKMLPESTYFKLGIESKEHTPTSQIWKDLIKSALELVDSDQLYKSVVIDGVTKEIMDRGSIIKEYIDIENKFQRVQCAYESSIKGYRCAVINRGGNSWLFGDLIKTYPICILYYFDGKKYNYSIYSEKKNIDVSMIAKEYGGGGHPGASGFTTDELVLPYKGRINW